MSAIEIKLLEATGLKTKKSEDRDAYLKRLVTAIEKKADNPETGDEFWDGLIDDEINDTAQVWFNTAITARNEARDKNEDDYEIEDFPDREEDETESETEEENEMTDTTEDEGEVKTKKATAKKAAPKAAKSVAPKEKEKVAGKAAKKVEAAPKEKKEKEKTAKAKSANGKERNRDGTKNAIIEKFLRRKNGCTAKELCEELGWPSIQMSYHATRCGLKLRQVKEPGENTRYYGIE
jgi:hypothetical protein